MPKHRAAHATADDFMSLALAEGVKGLGHTSPNPSVGAVVVRRGQVVGKGCTEPPGGAHAEIVALRQAGSHARGGDLYCTLEPCNHTGRTGPCAKAIAEAGIARVFYGSTDLNPHVRGGGAGWLRQAGVEVHGGVLLASCDRAHEAFFKHVTTGRPWLTLKVASTLDGRLAASSGDSRWISGPEARERVHRLRAQVDAVLVGSGTVLADNPQLTAREVGATRQPLRVVVEGTKPLPLSKRIFDTREAATLLITSSCSASRRRELDRKGVAVFEARAKRGKGVDLKAMLAELGNRGLMSVLCEGGANLATQLIELRHVDRLLLVLAPKLLGQGKSWLEAAPTRSMAKALALGPLDVERVGADLMITAELGTRRA